MYTPQYIYEKGLDGRVYKKFKEREDNQMNKEELEKEIAKAKKQLDKLQKALESKEYERWRPQYTEKYWYVTARGGVSCYNFVRDNVDYGLYDAFNCFKTKVEAEQEAEKILVRRQLEDIARRLNKNETPNWCDYDQLKYYIYYSFKTNKLKCIGQWLSKLAGVVYCLDGKFLDVAIKEIGEERLTKYLKG